MTFSSFLIILSATYLFYYFIVIVLDKMPAKKSLSAQSSNVDFVFAPTEKPVKIFVDESIKKYMPVVEDEAESEAPEVKQPVEVESLQDLMRMETYSDVAPEEIDGEELAGLMI